MRNYLRLSLLCAVFPFAVNLILFQIALVYREDDNIVVMCFYVMLAIGFISICASVVFLMIYTYKSLRARALSRWVVALQTLATGALLLAYFPVCASTVVTYQRLTRRPSDDLLDAIARKHYRNSEAVHFLNSDPNSISARNESRQTALHLAVVYDRAKLVELLVSRGADVICRDDYGQTPLHSSIDSRDVDIARLLILLGANIHATDNKGNTPLHLAARRAQKSSIELLILNGATVDIKNNDGKKPIDLALEQLSVQTAYKDRWLECISLLRQVGRASKNR